MFRFFKDFRQRINDAMNDNADAAANLMSLTTMLSGRPTHDPEHNHNTRTNR